MITNWEELQEAVAVAGLEPLPEWYMRVLVCGGRFYDNRALVYATLDMLMPHTMEIAHGACPYGGADILAEDWAKSREVWYRGYPAKFRSEGPSAGPKRNRTQRSAFQPHLVVAYPGGSGSADMTAVGRAAGVFVWEVKE